ncbi:MAG: lipopolysaccharide heptosyltransferase family protein [Proteobacteria bacterium]|nr:lipopolysaccharide heptosyltransferase family protein [Pseudomonadota bacterium]
MSLFKPRRSHSPSGVLLVSFGGLGDTVLLAQVIARYEALAEPGEKITVLLRRDSVQMGFLFPERFSVIEVDHDAFRRSWRYRRATLRGLYAANFRLVISLDHLRHPLLDERMIAACEASETIAMEPRSWRKYDARLQENRTLYNRLYDSGENHVDKVIRWTRFADWLTGETADPVRLGSARLNLPPPAKLEKPTVVLIPFSAVKEKQSLAELYHRLVGKLPSGYQAIIAGAPGDMDRNPSYQPLLELPNVHFDGSRFKDLVPTLRAARLVVSVDTAGMHLAVAAGAPTLCLASAAYVNEIVPYAEEITPPNVAFLYTPMDCAGCLGACIHPSERGMYPCVARLDEDQVLERFKSMLGGATPE